MSIQEVNSSQFIQHYFEKVYNELEHSPEAFLRAALEFVQREARLLSQPNAAESLARLVDQIVEDDSPMTSPDTGAPMEPPQVSMDSATDKSNVASASAGAAAAAAAAEPSELADAPALDDEGDDDEAGTSSEPQGITPNAGNGADFPTYSWTQSLSEVILSIPVPKGTKGRECDVSITRNNLRVGLRNAEPILSGPLYAAVQPDDCLWNLVDGCVLEITLQKVDAMAWWKAVVQGQPEINAQQIEPESSKLSDLDGDTRATVEKMMYDQRQKALGLPTSEEQHKQDILDKFMAAHPEMDFSTAKFM